MGWFTTVVLVLCGVVLLRQLAKLWKALADAAKQEPGVTVTITIREQEPGEASAQEPPAQKPSGD